MKKMILLFNISSISKIIVFLGGRETFEDIFPKINKFFYGQKTTINKDFHRFNFKEFRKCF